MKTRKTLIAHNTQLQAQLVACGPDATLSRRQLRERLNSARKEVEALTAQTTAQTARIEALTAEVSVLKNAAKQKAAKEAA